MNKFRLSIYAREHVLLREWLTEKRKSAGLTQRELALKLNCVHSLIAKVENGERRLDVIEFIAFCNALEINPSDGIDLIKKIEEQK